MIVIASVQLNKITASSAIRLSVRVTSIKVSSVCPSICPSISVPSKDSFPSTQNSMRVFGDGIQVDGTMTQRENVFKGFFFLWFVPSFLAVKISKARAPWKKRSKIEGVGKKGNGTHTCTMHKDTLRLS